MQALILDVYFVDPVPGHPQPPVAAIIKSWDGSLYVETNIREAAGQGRSVTIVDGCLRVAGHQTGGGLNALERQLFAEELTQQRG